MRLAVFGGNGQVATELRRRVPSNVTLEWLNRKRADFERPEMVFEAALSLNADAVVNAAAYTAVDKAESEPELAELVNSVSVKALANACAEKKIPLVHISTDYVFSGSGDRPWKTDDETGPLGVYGASKLAGETTIRAAGGQYAILRTSWVFSAHGGNFVKSMLRLGSEREQLPVVADQFGGPTPAAGIADACYTLAGALSDNVSSGTYHFAGAPDVNWAGFAREIFSQADLACSVQEISSAEFKTDAKRPLNSRLDCSTLEADFGITRPNWKKGLADVLAELKA